MTEPAPGLAPDISAPVSRASRYFAAFRSLLALLSLAVLFAPPYLIPTQVFQLGVISKYFALAILALSVDLIWGYTGLLSLGQGLFFGFGAYCVAYSLKLKQAAADKSDLTGVEVSPGSVPPDFMLYTGTASKDPNYLPPALEWVAPFNDIRVALAMAVLLPMLVALIFSLYTFRPRVRTLRQFLASYFLLGALLVAPIVYWWWGPLSAHPIVAAILIGAIAALLMGGLFASGFRIEGVYFSLLTQALLLAVFTMVRNQQRITGGVVGIKNIAEFQLWGVTFDPYKQNVTKLFFLTAWTLTGCLLLCGLLVRTKFGRLLTAIRDNENRVMALGYNTAMYKTFLFTMAGGLGGLAGAVYVAANTLAGPEYLSIVFSIMAVIWVALGGRGTLIGAVVGTLLVGWANTYISSAFPKHWTIVLGAIFLLVVVFLPKGLVGKAGRGALLGAMFGILYVEAFIGWLRETMGASGIELSEVTSKLVGCLFVLVVIFVPRAILSVLAILIRLFERNVRRISVH